MSNPLIKDLIKHCFKNGKYIYWYRVRVVKEIDLKSIMLCMRRFKSCRYRFFYLFILNEEEKKSYR